MNRDTNKEKKSICFYFQVHQPWRLSRLNILHLNEKRNLFEGTDQYSNQKIFDKVSEKCYFPTNKLLTKLIHNYPEFKLTFSISGTLIDQARQYDKKVLNSFKKLFASPQVELLNETYYHSLSWLFSKLEFAQQIQLHRSICWSIFKRRPTAFRNTELIYNNEIANFAKYLGFKTILAEGWENKISFKNPNYVYEGKKGDLHHEDRKIADTFSFSNKNNLKIKLLLKNYKLSDDVAFRFSDRGWANYPLTIEQYFDWIDHSEGNTINLFMDYETFGEHQWEDTGIFDFLAQIPKEAKKRNITFKTVSETVRDYKSRGEIDVHELTSWADAQRDLSAWIGNSIQESALKSVYALEERILRITKGGKNKEDKALLLETWRRLQTSDHFYYMSTKYWKDGDVHKYFSPYDSPYNAYINYMNCLNDFILRIEQFESSQ